MKRFGTVLVFREEVTAEEAAAALEKIRELLDVPETTMKTVPTGKTEVMHFEPGQVYKPIYKTVYKPFEMADLITEYNDDHGGPVWYIP